MLNQGLRILYISGMYAIVVEHSSIIYDVVANRSVLTLALIRAGITNHPSIVNNLGYQKTRDLLFLFGKMS